MDKASINSFFTNLWYYHKWKILVGALILLVLAVTVTQCLQRDEPDVSIVYVGDMDIGGAAREGIEKGLADLYGDADGDGEKHVAVTFMGGRDKDTKDRLQIEVVAGEHYIYVLDREHFDWLMQYKVLAPLKDVLGEVPEGAVNAYGIELKYLDIAETEGFNAMARNSIVCLRGNAEDGAFNYGAATAAYKNNADFFINAVRYKKDGFERKTLKMALIGDRDLYQNTVDYMEDSLYYIAKQNDPNTAPVLDYGSMQLKYKEGQHIFGDAEKKRTEEMAAGGKILLLDIDAYLYLAERGLLLDIGSLGIDLPDGADTYGIELYKLDLHAADGFFYADDWSAGKSRIYLCASSDSDDYTVDLLRYLYTFKSEVLK